MTKVVEHTESKLVIENKPCFAFGITIGLGAIAFLASAYALLFSGDGFSKDTAFGLVLGIVFVVGGLLLYRETETVLDKRAGKVTWKQEGLLVSKSDSANLSEIEKVVVGRPQGGESNWAAPHSIDAHGRAIAKLRCLMQLIEDYRVVFATGGARTQLLLIAKNFGGRGIGASLLNRDIVHAVNVLEVDKGYEDLPRSRCGALA